MNQGSGNQSSILQTFVKKVLAHLDENNPQALNGFLTLFNGSGNCKIIMNATPIAQPMMFLQMWQEQVVQSQHNLTSMDYHIIPGSGSIICNIGCKVRFDESGRDKRGQDAIVTNTGMPNTNVNARPVWGSYHGVSIQVIVDDRVLRNDLNGVISGFNYNMVYKPEDSLISIQ
ncbi:hypothetical protein Kpol_1001p29 [Vanderwaltozyma polyspora DSM 70294]|uniref:mRNA transport regulator MTR2 n=1 Tax=Vanderwaltozyma polyspora (strain ATCC 22028 / DSM 70294 / BCRC 21397 / CBS 2163 / NBRC 10782 / NRRL Y-8283 / UCD 57-17) TaxID=436907 RepID=A7TNR6_VANPO|nr:uncharacterized protein Kpol_1001p29 [Vanderwaltozyma polyspora DSM 70294]EDO16117.1 hypothetical protein Kpol_1001p29 [Vanderwaltozyma polyspora DSM 70294]